MSKILRMLIVDDFDLIRMMLKKTLKELGYTEMEEAVDGLDAYEKIVQAKAEGRSYDLVFLDWNMPVMTGLELLQKCKKSEDLKDIPFIMITAESEQKKIVSAIKLGVADYAIKPFSPAQLSKKIERVLNSIKAGGVKSVS